MPKRGVHEPRSRAHDGWVPGSRTVPGTMGRVAPPIIDISELRSAPTPPDELVAAIDVACTTIGFFVVTGHGLEPQVDEVFDATRALFALPEASKEAFSMVERQGFVPAHHHKLDDTIRSAPAEYYD